MTSENPVVTEPTTAPAAVPAQTRVPAHEAILDDIMARVGVDGLLAAAGSPALRAAVDQHAAAVRESLAAQSWAVDIAALAGYGKSVAAAATRMGRALPDPAGMDWSRASWFQVRLIAVCALAVEHGA